MKRHRKEVAAAFLGLCLLIVAGCGRPKPAVPGDTAAAAPVVDPLAGQAGESIALQVAVTCDSDDAREMFLPDGTIVEVDEKTELAIDRVEEVQGAWKTQLSLRRGAIRLDVPRSAGRTFEVKTPVAVAGVRGTDFAVAHDETQGTEVDVFDGRVAAAAAGQEEIVTRDQAAIATRQQLQRGRVNEAVRRRWENARARIADRLIERFQLDIDSDSPPDLDEVLRQIPEAVRERARQRMRERIAERRQVLQKALREAGDTIDRQAMTAQDRFEAARRNWIQQDDERRRVFRERVQAGRKKWQLGLEALADTMARAGAMDAANRLREAARHSEEDMRRLSDTLARTSQVAPQFTVAVGPAEGSGAVAGERRLLVQPAPPLPGNHRLVKERHTLKYRVRIGPAGAVREVKFISATIPRAESQKFDNLLKLWRFNADLERQPEWRTITITSVPR